MFTFLSKYKKKIKSLTLKKKKNAGRNNLGKITVYHQGGGHKRLYRNIDFQYNNPSGLVTNLEYDPNRTANIAKICYRTKNSNKYYYILAPQQLNSLDKISTEKINNTNLNIGNNYLLNDFNIGDYIYNIELYPGKGAQLARSAGTFGEVYAKTENYVTIKLPSGQYRLFNPKCTACLGSVSNENHKNRIIKKAGRSRWLNKRPTVRGVAMNPVDHPHGGGEGKTSGGRPSVTPWAKITKGKPTRSKKKKNKLILK